MSTPYDPKMDDLQETSEAVYQSAVREWNYGKPAPNKAQHSPLPWQIINGGIFDANASMVYPAETKRDEANAALIVRAVNHADKLAEALKQAQAWLIACSDKDYTYARQAIAIKASEALAAYEAAQ